MTVDTPRPPGDQVTIAAQRTCSISAVRLPCAACARPIAASLPRNEAWGVPCCYVGPPSRLSALPGSSSLASSPWATEFNSLCIEKAAF